MVEIGDRVGALISLNNSEGLVKLLGYGKYMGREIPESGTCVLGDLFKEQGISNPCILLDSGERVYGFECWWDKEEAIKKIEQEAIKVIQVSVSDFRGKHKEKFERKGFFKRFVQLF
jgi:hypothetical protein